MARNRTRTPSHQGRRPLPARSQAGARTETTIGDLIAAAFDTVGNEVHDVARLLSSRALRKSSGGRIVVVQ
jgi:hypothetical protein